MSLKKLALVTAMFAATSGAYAMEALDEDAMAAATGQDGISIGLSTSASLDVIIHDNDGFAAAPNSGAIVIQGVGIAGAGGTGKADIGIMIDAGSSAAGATDATLNIGITTGAMQVALGNLSVANSNREGGVGWGYDVASAKSVLNLGTINLTGVSMNVQLGDQPQGHLIAMNTTLTGGLTLTGVSLNDTVHLGSISVGTLAVTGKGVADLAVDMGIDATATGLAITVNQLGLAGGAGVGGIDVTMAGVNVGGTGNIGDVEIRGLNMNGDTITISGH